MSNKSWYRKTYGLTSIIFLLTFTHNRFEWWFKKKRCYVHFKIEIYFNICINYLRIFSASAVDTVNILSFVLNVSPMFPCRPVKVLRSYVLVFSGASFLWQNKFYLTIVFIKLWQPSWFGCNIRIKTSYFINQFITNK